MRIFCLTSLAVFGVGSISRADVFLEFQFGYILAANGTAIPTGSKVVIVADTLGNGFVGSEVGAFGGTWFSSSLPIGASFNVGTLWGADDMVLGHLYVQDTGLGSGQLTQMVAGAFNVNYIGNLNPGDRLGLYFFPGTTSAFIPLPSQYGFFSQSAGFDIDSGAGRAMTLPPDGFADTISYFTPQLYADSSTDTSGHQFQPLAEFRASAWVPEPSVYGVVAGVAVFFACILKRRSRSQ